MLYPYPWNGPDTFLPFQPVFPKFSSRDAHDCTKPPDYWEAMCYSYVVRVLSQPEVSISQDSSWSSELQPKQREQFRAQAVFLLCTNGQIEVLCHFVSAYLKNPLVYVKRCLVYAVRLVHNWGLIMLLLAQWEMGRARETWICDKWKQCQWR